MCGIGGDVLMMGWRGYRGGIRGCGIREIPMKAEKRWREREREIERDEKKVKSERAKVVGIDIDNLEIESGSAGQHRIKKRERERRRRRAGALKQRGDNVHRTLVAAVDVVVDDAANDAANDVANDMADVDKENGNDERWERAGTELALSWLFAGCGCYQNTVGDGDRGDQTRDTRRALSCTQRPLDVHSTRTTTWALDTFSALAGNHSHRLLTGLRYLLVVLEVAYSRTEDTESGLERNGFDASIYQSISQLIQPFQRPRPARRIWAYARRPIGQCVSCPKDLCCYCQPRPDNRVQVLRRRLLAP